MFQVTQPEYLIWHKQHNYPTWTYFDVAQRPQPAHYVTFTKIIKHYLQKNDLPPFEY